MAQIQELSNLRFLLNDIISATNNFADKNYVGEGGFGKVYIGQFLPSGTFVTLQRLDLGINISKQEQSDQFLEEIVALASYKHDNLVSLHGFCDGNDEKILVYKQEANGSLDHHLANTSLTWEQRIRVCLGVARGLDYLHEGGVLHRNIKSSNIFLDVNWEAKISDIGLSGISPKNQDKTYLVTKAAATLGYTDPLYLMTGIYRKEFDVYSFGMVLFQVLGNLAIIAPDLEDGEKLEQINKFSLQAFSKIAYQSVDIDQRKRPTMRKIIQGLETALKFQIDCAGDMQTRLWGSSTGGNPWSFTVKNNENLKKITIDHNDWIYSVIFTTVGVDGSLHSTEKYGGINGPSRGKISKIHFLPDEEIVGVTGTFNIHNELLLISSLCFVTTKGRKGPFGKETGLKTERCFSESWDKGLFAGFHGRYGSYLDGIGCVLKVVAESKIRNKDCGELVRTKLWGSSTDGIPWSCLFNENRKLSKIIIHHDDFIYTIGFMSKHEDCRSSQSYGYGVSYSMNVIASQMNLEADEEVTGISGTSNKHVGGFPLISALTITTNKKWMCFGKETGKDTEIRFSETWDVGLFAGFYGRCEYYVHGLGCVLKTMADPEIQSSEC